MNEINDNGNYGYNPLYDDTPMYDFEIKYIKLVPSRNDGYRDMFIRPYASKIQYKDVENMMDNFVNTGKFRPEDNNMIGISSGIVGKAGISGGWGQKRYTFTMEVRCRSKRSLTIHDLIINGYTDPTYSIKTNMYTNDFSSFDCDLRFHINACKKVDLDQQERVISVTDLGVMDDETVDNNITRSLRPSDVITNIQLKMLADDLGGNSSYANNDVNRYNVTFNRKHNNSGQYLSSVFDAVTENCSDHTVNDVMISSPYKKRTNNILHGTSVKLSSIPIHNVPFVHLLNSSYTSPGHNKFNINSLRMVCPNLHPATIMVMEVDDTPMYESMNHLSAGVEYTMGFNGVDVYTPIIQDIHNLFMNFLISNYLGFVDVTIHNLRGPDEFGFDKPKVKFCLNNAGFLKNQMLENGKVIDGIINNNLNSVCKKVDAYLNKNGLMQYQININMSMGLDSTIQVLIQGSGEHGNFETNEPRIYRFPTFADMNFTPMAGGEIHMEGLSNDIEQVVHAIQEGL